MIFNNYDDNSRENKDNFPYEYWLHCIPGIGNKKISYMLKQGVTAKDLFFMSEEDLNAVWNRTYPDKTNRSIGTSMRKDIQNIIYAKINKDPILEYKKLCNQNIEFISINSAHYPERLKKIPDPPYALYRIGKTAEEDIRNSVCVAVVGARQCSAYGRNLAMLLGQRCALHKIDLVSGLASGIDGIAQNAARMSGGKVTAVLGNGVDICYPMSNKQIYDDLAREGEIISEYIPGTQPRAQNFPPRNRIISGLADAVIVVEAKEKSGTLITVDMALEQGRDVYVLPGRITDPMSYGCNRLISQGAEIIYNIDETLLGIISTKTSKNNTEETKAEIPACMPEHINPYPLYTLKGQLYNIMDYAPCSVQSFYEALDGYNVSEITAALMQMELEGCIEEEGGRYNL